MYGQYVQSERETPILTSKCRSENNIEVHLKEIKLGIVQRVNLAQDRDQ
jgi:hypothetical protein